MSKLIIQSGVFARTFFVWLAVKKLQFYTIYETDSIKKIQINSINI